MEKGTIMDSISLRSIAKDCLSLTPPYSVKSDIIGPKLPGYSSFSLKRQIKILKAPGFNMNLILAESESEKFSDEERVVIGKGVENARDILLNVNLGIHKINWIEEPNLYPYVFDEGDALNLLAYYTGPNDDYLDAFIVKAIRLPTKGNTTPGGVSMCKIGSCNKHYKGGCTGIIVSTENIWGNDDDSKKIWLNDFGHSLAHELGHYLGGLPDLVLGRDANNLMYKENNKNADNVDLTEDQGNDMKKHCFVKVC